MKQRNVNKNNENIAFRDDDDAFIRETSIDLTTYGLQLKKKSQLTSMDHNKYAEF